MIARERPRFDRAHRMRDGGRSPNATSDGARPVAQHHRSIPHSLGLQVSLSHDSTAMTDIARETDERLPFDQLLQQLLFHFIRDASE